MIWFSASSAVLSIVLWFWSRHLLRLPEASFSVSAVGAGAIVLKVLAILLGVAAATTVIIAFWP